MAETNVFLTGKIALFGLVRTDGTAGVGATITLSTAIGAIDSISFPTTDYFVSGDRILVKDEDRPGGLGAFANGVYTINSTGKILTRAIDFDSPAEVRGGDFVFIEYGSKYGSTGWVQTQDTDAISSTGSSILFLQFAGVGTYIAADNGALTLDGQAFSVNVNNSTGGIEIVSNSLQLTPGLAGNGLSYTDGVLKVVGTSGSYGFGVGFLTKKETLGIRYRTQIYNQILDKYDLRKYSNT